MFLICKVLAECLAGDTSMHYFIKRGDLDPPFQILSHEKQGSFSAVYDIEDNLSKVRALNGIQSSLFLGEKRGKGIIRKSSLINLSGHQMHVIFPRSVAAFNDIAISNDPGYVYA